MTVARLRREMTEAEFRQWAVYFGREAQQIEMARAKGGH